MAQSLSSGSNVSRKFRGLLVTLFVGMLALVVFSSPLGSRIRAFAAPDNSVFSLASDSAALNTSHRIYVQDWDRIAVLDSGTGKMLHQIPLGQFAYDIGVSLAVDPALGWLFVADTQWDSENQAVDTLTVYRTSDWGIEKQLLVPNIVHYVGNSQSSITVSSDSKYLYVYNYSAYEQAGMQQIRYWISVLDLATWTWLPREIDLQDCGAGRLFPTAPHVLYILCYGSADVRVVNTAQLDVVSQSSVIPAQPHSQWSLTGISSAAIMKDTLYLATDNREIHIKNPLVPQADRTLTGPASAVQRMAGDRIAAQKIVPFQPIGLSNDGRHLLVPTGTEDERSHGIASKIAVISTESGEVTKTLHLQPFLWITFASDGATALIVVAAPDTPKHFGTKLVRLDLISGEETEILSGAVLPGMVITP